MISTLLQLDREQIRSKNNYREIKILFVRTKFKFNSIEIESVLFGAVSETRLRRFEL